MRKAIVTCADTGPLESLVIMLESVGYQCYIPSEDLKQVLRSIGCDCILDIQNLVRGMGYDQPKQLPVAGPRDMETCDLFVDLKAHRNGPKVWGIWPRLENKTLWYRINGGKPEHVKRGGIDCHLCRGSGKQTHGTEKDPGPNSPTQVSNCAMCGGSGKLNQEDCGDEVNPPCPVLTPNQWYQEPAFLQAEHVKTVGSVATMKMPGWADKAYAFWPPFARLSDYDPLNRSIEYTDPICLIHNVQGWGYQALVGPMRDQLGVRIYGNGSPDGCLQHQVANDKLTSALAMVHLKSSDAPGYAIYEAMAAGCPVICTRRLIWRCQMQDLLIPGETCLVFDRETHDGLTPEDVASCLAEVRGHLEFLRDPYVNKKIGQYARQQLEKVMWSPSNGGDVADLTAFIGRNFE